MFGSYDPRWDDDPRDAYDVDPRDRDEDDGSTSPVPDSDPRDREPEDQCERDIERDHGWDSTSCDQSRSLRARREASSASTAPAAPEQTVVSRR